MILDQQSDKEVVNVLTRHCYNVTLCIYLCHKRKLRYSNTNTTKLLIVSCKSNHSTGIKGFTSAVSRDYYILKPDKCQIVAVMGQEDRSVGLGSYPGMGSCEGDGSFMPSTTCRSICHFWRPT